MVEIVLWVPFQTDVLGFFVLYFRLIFLSSFLIDNLRYLMFIWFFMPFFFGPWEMRIGTLFLSSTKFYFLAQLISTVQVVKFRTYFHLFNLFKITHFTCFVGGDIFDTR